MPLVGMTATCGGGAGASAVEDALVRGTLVTVTVVREFAAAAEPCDALEVEGGVALTVDPVLFAPAVPEPAEAVAVLDFFLCEDL
jgi:hypothetical protein